MYEDVKNKKKSQTRANNYFWFAPQEVGGETSFYSLPVKRDLVILGSYTDLLAFQKILRVPSKATGWSLANAFNFRPVDLTTCHFSYICKFVSQFNLYRRYLFHSGSTFVFSIKNMLIITILVEWTIEVHRSTKKHKTHCNFLLFELES